MLVAVFIHPHFNATTLDNNIGIIELKYAVPCDNQKVCAVCLPSAHLMNATYRERTIRDDLNQCVALGWRRKTLGKLFFSLLAVVSCTNNFIYFAGNGSGTQLVLKETNYSPIYNNHSLCASYVRKNGDLVSSLPTRSFCGLPEANQRNRIYPVCQEDNGMLLVYFLRKLSNFYDVFQSLQEVRCCVCMRVNTF